MEIFNITNNEQLVRLVGEGEAAIMLATEAIEIADERNLDLVKLNESNGITNVKICDFNKMVFDQKKKEKQKLKKQHENKKDIKEIRITIGTSEHDIETKARQIDKFIKHGDSVIVSVVFKGRAMKFMKLGYDKLDEVTCKVTEKYVVKNDKHIEGNKVSMTIASK